MLTANGVWRVEEVGPRGGAEGARLGEMAAAGLVPVTGNVHHVRDLEEMIDSRLVSTTGCWGGRGIV